MRLPAVVLAPWAFSAAAHPWCDSLEQDRAFNSSLPWKGIGTKSPTASVR